MSTKQGDRRPIVRGGGQPDYERRAVVGASGKPREGMILESGAQTVAKVLGRYTRSDRDVRTTGGHFNVSDLTDVSIGAPGDGSEGGSVKG